MKKLILFTTLYLFSITIYNCNQNDDLYSQKKLKENLIGEWKTILNGGIQTFHKTLIFRNDNSADFIIYLSPNTNYYEGKWILEDDILTISFPDSLNLPIYKQKISFPDENSLHFEKVPDIEYEIVENDFFRVH